MQICMGNRYFHSSERTWVDGWRNAWRVSTKTRPSICRNDKKKIYFLNSTLIKYHSSHICFPLILFFAFYFLSDVGRATNLIVAGQIFLTPVTIPFMLRCTQRVFHFESIRSRVMSASIKNFYFNLVVS